MTWASCSWWTTPPASRPKPAPPPAASSRTALRHRRPRDEAGVLGFARQAAVWQGPGGQQPASRPLARHPRPPIAPAPTIGRALDFAASVLPPGPARRVVLLSDGNDTAAAGRQTAARLAAAGIQVDTVPLHNPATPEVLVASVDVPRGLRSGEPFDLHADVESNVATTARVNLYANQFLAGSLDLTVQPGRNDVRFPSLHAGDGFTTYEVEILPAADTRLENNRAGATVSLNGKGRVLLVAGDEARAAPLAAALGEAQIDVETRGAHGLPASLGELQTLRPVPARRRVRPPDDPRPDGALPHLGAAVRRRLRDDRRREPPSGWADTSARPSNRCSPCRMEHDDRQETPSVALYVVLDRSGSMTAPVGGTTKIGLADQGSVLAMNVLQSQDLFGLTAVDTQVNPVVPLGRIGAKGANEQKILSITAGGGGHLHLHGVAGCFADHARRPGQDQARHPVLRRRRPPRKRTRARCPTATAAGAGASAGGHLVRPRQRLAGGAGQHQRGRPGHSQRQGRDLPARAGRARQRPLLPDRRRHHAAADSSARRR